MLKSEMQHYLNPNYKTGIEKSEQTIKLFGIVIFRKTYHYPKVVDECHLRTLWF